MAAKTKLSLAIPTFNFGRFVGATLRSILEQRARLSRPDAVEVVVLDGASTDETAAVVTAFPAVRYIRREARGGIDVDMDLAVRFSNGEYVWLCSADDLLTKGALEAALHQLRLHPEVDVTLAAHTNCDLNTMVPLDDHPVFPDRSARQVDLGIASERHRWLKEAVSTEAVFSFMSTIIVRRSIWMEQPEPLFVGTCWSHVARLFGRAASGSLMCRFVGENWIHRRNDNDSFMDKGLIHRLRLAFFLVDIFRHFFGAGSVEHTEVHRLLSWEIGRPTMLRAARTLLHDRSPRQVAEWVALVDERYPLNTFDDRCHRLILKHIPTPVLMRFLDSYHSSPLPTLRAAIAARRKAAAPRGQ